MRRRVHEAPIVERSDPSERSDDGDVRATRGGRPGARRGSGATRPWPGATSTAITAVPTAATIAPTSAPIAAAVPQSPVHCRSTNAVADQAAAQAADEDGDEGERSWPRGRQGGEGAGAARPLRRGPRAEVVGCAAVRPLVVLPTYNEAQNIAEVLAQGARCGAATRRSSSSTTAAPTAPPTSPRRSGASSATSRCCGAPGSQVSARPTAPGSAQGLERDHDVLIEMDSDLSARSRRAARRCSPRSTTGADLVIGSRYVPGGTIPNWKLHRRLLSRWGNRYAGLRARACPCATRPPASGPTRRRRCEKIDLDAVKADGYGFQIEMAYAVAAQRRPHRRGADLVQGPRAGHVEDVEPHRRRGARPRDLVGRSATASCGAGSRRLPAS